MTQVCDFVWRPKVEDRNFPKSLSHLVLLRQGILSQPPALELPHPPGIYLGSGDPIQTPVPLFVR